MGAVQMSFLNDYRYKLSVIRRLYSPPANKIERVCQFLLWVAITAYILYFLRLTFSLYERLAETTYDLGIFDQAI